MFSCDKLCIYAVYRLNRYLRPVLEDDAILLCLEELLLYPAGFEGARSGEEHLDEDGDCFPVAADCGETETKGSTGEDEIDEDRMMQALKPPATGRSYSQEQGGEAYYRNTEISELKKENASLREALQDAEARMARANKVLRSLATGGDGEDAENERAALLENHQVRVSARRAACSC